MMDGEDGRKLIQVQLLLYHQNIAGSRYKMYAGKLMTFEVPKQIILFVWGTE
jgi:hypothetical protein